VAALLALPAGYLSWKYIENPFRGRHGLFTRRQLFLSAAAASVFLFAAGSVGFVLQGAPQRFPARLASALPRPNHQSPCQNQSLASLNQGELCRVGTGTSAPLFLIWGDSHADMYYDQLIRLADRNHITGIIVSSNSCPPLVGLNPKAPGMAECEAKDQAVLKQIAALHVKTVLLAARWAVCGVDEDTVMTLCVPRFAQPGVKASEKDASNLLAARLAETVARLRAAGANVYFVRDVPEAQVPVAPLVAKARILGVDLRGTVPPVADVALTLAAFKTQADPADRALRPLTDAGAVQVIDPSAYLCDAQFCALQKDGISHYNDNHHLSGAGAKVAMQAFAPLFQSLAGAAPALDAGASN
jgi:hypothetical protein